MPEAIEIFPWNKNFETGIAEIDEQHHVIVSLINTLANRLIYEPDIDLLNQTFSELSDYAVYHFQCEEAIWLRHFSNTSYLETHKKTHISFVSSLTNLKEEEETESLQTVFEDLLSFLSKWLAHHILEDDMRMSKVILAMDKGFSFDEAVKRANKHMDGAMQVILETTLSMYETLCKRTLDLHKEIIERKKIESGLRLASSVFNNTLEAICITDTQSVITDANLAFFKLTGYKREEVIGNHIATLKSGLEDKILLDEIWQELNTNNQWHGQVQSRNKNGELQSEWLGLSTIKDEQNKIVNFIGIFSNISSLIKNQVDLEYLAHHDALTQLPNRMLLADRLEQAILNAKRKNELFAVCFLDLDGFKPVNDTYGHATGDQLLCEVANRIKQIIRGNDTVARVGGDEFVILFNELQAVTECEALLDRLLTGISCPISIEQNNHCVGASIGISLYPNNGETPESLLHHADKAMYEAKRLGKSQYQFYSPAIL